MVKGLAKGWAGLGTYGYLPMAGFQIVEMESTEVVALTSLVSG